LAEFQLVFCFVPLTLKDRAASTKVVFPLATLVTLGVRDLQRKSYLNVHPAPPISDYLNVRLAIIWMSD